MNIDSVGHLLCLVLLLVPVVFVDGPGLKEKEGALGTGYTPVRTGSVGEVRPESVIGTGSALEVMFSTLPPVWGGSAGRENSG